MGFDTLSGFGVVGEKECLAIVWAVQILRLYLERSHFELYTDHIALKWMMNLTDASGRLARWRMRLLEFDFTVQYKKGAKNTIADCVSRLPTFNETTKVPDATVPCFGVFDDTGFPGLNVVESESDPTPATADERLKELFEEMDDKDLQDESVGRNPDPVCEAEETRDFSSISIEEFIETQATDSYCQQVRKEVALGTNKLFQINNPGLLVRIAPLDRAGQVLVPASLRATVLNLCHYPRMVGHPEVRACIKPCARLSTGHRCPWTYTRASEPVHRVRENA